MLLLLISSPFSYSQYLPPNVPADYLPAPSPSTEGILDVMAQRALIDPPSLLKRAVGRAILKTEGGDVLGTTSEEGIARFAAIPYAAPPIPRFRPPQPAKPWQGERNGTEFGARCYEAYNPLYPPPSTRAYSEDCLFANVFTPLSAVGNPAAALPVLVWIHGGAYQAGSANDYDATKLVAKSGGAVCVVTINYRLGVFGFLGSDALRRLDPTAGSTGNSGVQDQRTAIQWARRNAKSFGGDPKRVTVFGESAGAGSIAFHLTSARSPVGLFDGAIPESSLGASWTAHPMAVGQTVFEQVANATKCGTAAAAAGSGDAVDCLVALPATNLSHAMGIIPAGMCCGGHQGKIWITWAPTIDGVELKAHPYETIQKAKLTLSVPIMHGTNADEGAPFVGVSKYLLHPALMADWKKWYTPVMGAGAAERLDKLFYDTNTTYPPAGVRTRAWWAADRAMTDQVCSCGARMSSRALSSSSQPIFQYEFAPSSWGVVPHGAEIGYLFQAEWLKGEDLTLAAQMLGMWTHFAASRRPTADADAWPTYNAKGSADGPYLRLDVASTGGSAPAYGFHAKSCEGFFDEFTARSLKRETFD
jgi:para-nitrobenzyl esterase